ncbi:chemotaxis protein CheD [Arenibacterium halophilum]|uniref:Probable chemoreceptor glutamine deamidase CheD n=1 Tax=Arenibacterium halophilum TaxID=2583821 RepID=A0ABY2X9B2_9RHOB|nr:chemotaxis protein CheD [Arenibacterium halophilum]TMV12936.1 chemotaxis protein CheD [Arenibacterium halophilum]
MRIEHVIQGEFKASDDPEVTLTTILGSCVSTCLFDAIAGVGGMNHFLLPKGDSGASVQNRYGLLAMELLINELLKMGASKSRLQAKLFGGAMMDSRLGRIGDENGRFALAFLENENIPCISSSLGGTAARRVRFTPSSGAAQQMLIADHVEKVPEPVVEVGRAVDSDITLF